MSNLHNFFGVLDVDRFYNWSEYNDMHPVLLDSKVNHMIFYGKTHPDLTIAMDLDNLITRIVKKDVTVTDDNIYAMMNSIRTHEFKDNDVRRAIISILHKLVTNESGKFPDGNLRTCVICTMTAITPSKATAVRGIEQCPSCKQGTITQHIPQTREQTVEQTNTIPDLQRTDRIDELQQTHQPQPLQKPAKEETTSFIHSWLLVPVYIISLGVSIGLVARRR